MINDFENASDLERQKMINLFTSNGVVNYLFTPSKGFDREDGYYTAYTATITKEVIFEVKNRDIASDKYPTTIIEKDKVDYILKKAKETNHQPFLFFFFNDNKYMAIKLNPDTYYSTIWMKAPSTTMGNNQMIMKEFVQFNITKLESIQK